MIRKQFPELYYFAPSIIVGKEGSYYYAMKYRDKYPFVKSSDASEVINSALNSLTPDRTWKEKIVLKGDFVFFNSVTVPSYTIIQIDGKIKLADSVGKSIFKISNANDIDIFGGIIDGNEANNPWLDDITEGHGIYVDSSQRVRIYDIYLYSIVKKAVFFSNVTDGIIRGIKVNDARGIPIAIEGGNNVWVTENNIYLDLSRTAHGIDVSGGATYVYVVNNVVENGSVCIEVWGDGTKYVNIIGNLVKTSQDGAGIRFEDRVTYCNIIGNICYGCKYSGIFLRNSNYNNVRGNIVISPTDNCLCIEGNTEGYGQYNIMSNNLLIGGQYGIRELGDYVDYNVFKNNEIYDQTTTPASIIGTNTVIKHNIGYATENSGVATFSGDGSTTEFKIEHGLVSTPSKYAVSPLTPDADASRTITVDDTYIIITFSTAPPSGTDNIKFGWWAEV